MPEVGFQKVGDEVFLHGRAEVATAEPVLILPVEARPHRALRFSVGRAGGVGTATVAIDGAVVVDPDLGSGWADLENVHFVIGQ